MNSIKIIKVGPFWYSMTSNNELMCNKELNEKKENWILVESLSKSQYDEISKEFTFNESIVKIEASKEHVKSILLEDPIAVAKFDTWHAPVTLEKKNITPVTLEDPVAVAKFDTWHAPISTREKND